VPEPPRWRVASDAVFVWRQWEQEFVLYHENSGDTHRLNAVSAQIVRLLAHDPLTTSEISTRLGDESNGGDGLAPLLRHLFDLGLIECDAPVVTDAV
jgi:PqqD family protein of HPr-rel-A system